MLRRLSQKVAGWVHKKEELLQKEHKPHAFFSDLYKSKTSQS